MLWLITDDDPFFDASNSPPGLLLQAVIRSRAALSYQEAQMRIDDKRMDDDITVGLRRLMKVSRVLRARRTAAGALTLASPEVKFQLDSETQDPLDVGMYQVGSLIRDLRSLTPPPPPPPPSLSGPRTHTSPLICCPQTRETNHMVEEMMLLGNITVAEKILQVSCSISNAILVL